MKESRTCPQCGGEIAANTDQCSSCGAKLKQADGYSRKYKRVFPIFRLLISLTAGVGLGGLSLTWAVFGMELHTGFEIIAGSLFSVHETIRNIDASTATYIQNTQLLVIGLAGLYVTTFILNALSFRRYHLLLATAIFVMYIALDVIFLIFTFNIPLATAPGMLILDGKGFHISQFSLVIGSIAAFLNLISPRIFLSPNLK